MRMDIESALVIPEVKENRLKDDILTLFDEDFPPSIKGVKDWLIEGHSSLSSYWNRSSKITEILRKNLGFHDGMKYLLVVLLSELTLDQGKSLEAIILDDLSELVYNYCEDCKAKID